MQKHIELASEGGVEAGAESIESKVILYFRRHGKKEKTKEGQADAEVPLTPDGRKQAVALGKELNPHPRVALAAGSLRRRAKEVAALAMTANEPSITPEMTLEQIEAEIAKEVKYGKKIISDPRLDFSDEGSSEFKRLDDKAYGEKRTTDFLIHESDQVVIDNKDLRSTSYTRLAAQVAELVKKYVGVSNNFNQAVEKEPKKYEEFKNQMERFLGTHNTVGESFIAKVIEKQDGIAAREEFLEALGLFGFKEAEGFDVEIINHGQTQEIVIHVKAGGKEWHVKIDMETLDRMIEDRVKFDERIKSSVSN